MNTDETKRDAEPSPASAGSVSEQLVERLRGGWPYRGMDARILCDEAAAEIERLRLTDEEREAVKWCIFQQATPQGKAVALRRLLDRLG